MPESPRLVAEAIPIGTKLSLVLGDAEVAHLDITPFRMRVGEATVQVEGIGDVWTDNAHRNRGYARLLMEEAVRRMRAGDGALSVLYGINDFYPKFGYAVAGPEQLVVLDELARSAAPPAGWGVRGATASDLPAIRALYDRTTAGVTGAAVREPPGPSWSGQAWAKLAAALDQPDAGACRVVTAPDGHLAASCWRGADVWFVSMTEEWQPETMALAEVLAESPPAAEAALAACRSWGAEEATRRGRPLTTVTLAVPHASHLARAAAFQDALILRRHSRAGGFMARALDPFRLLAQLSPELGRRLSSSGAPFDTLGITTDEGAVTLRLAGDTLSVEPAAAEAGPAISLPHEALAQLALGAFPPEDVLARLGQPADGQAAEIVQALFPLRQAHLFPPDRP